jgi:hypothetical protein
LEEPPKKSEEIKKSDIFSEFPEITKIAENIKSKFPKDFDLNTFKEITDQILSNLKKDYSLDYISTFIKEKFENIFVNILNEDIEFFNQKTIRRFQSDIDDFIITEEKRKAEEEKRKAEEEKRKAEEEKRKAEEEKRKAEEENITKVTTKKNTENKVVDTENKVVDSKVLNKKELNNITILRN